MSSAIHGQHVDSAIVVGRTRENVYVGREIVRHRRLSRLIHWSVALTFFISVFSGAPIWHPLFGWMAYLVGGLEVARLIHPYAGVLFFIMSGVQFFHWLGDMRLNGEEEGWWRPSKLMSYMRYEDEPAAEGGGKYNPGQKLFFFAVCLGALALLISGIPMWFPTRFPPIIRELSYLLHDITWIFFIVGIVTHIYLGTAAEPGTFHSMTRGTVTRSWARLHHPGWFRQVSGEETRED
ncbi:MAG TPA: formate dehydrogenase subunit gamma [Thermoanaerobaculia bacterium]